MALLLQLQGALLLVVRYFADMLHLTQLYELAFGAFMRYFVERDLVPDFLLRRGIRLLLRKRLAETLEEQVQHKVRFVEELKVLPVAVQTAAANEQHYELPTEYFTAVLGTHRKYSSCLYNSPRDSLDKAEANMLALYCVRAGLREGQDILELGCGWGSLSLFVARAFPGSRVTAVSNSRTQREYILQRAQELDVRNLQVITADMVEFQATAQYDRIVSIEMFEHMKNYQELLRRCSTWLRPGGQLFVHIFCHKTNPYHFEVRSEDDWMAKYFFSGGTMPSLDLLLHFQRHLAISGLWYVSGTHYSRTLEAWLVNHDKERRYVMGLFERTYGRAAALKWFVYWRLFYLACSELFNFNGGEEWGVGHYLFTKPQGPEAAAVSSPRRRAAAGAGANGAGGGASGSVKAAVAAAEAGAAQAPAAAAASRRAAAK
ncbi:cyclopropane-fatty-acyl-phospholipid synthase [Monoraphidium neglectum]|uniref:Cyclopropane-fatty-acyl-phospholipid synthase n=1 Tax=Monoraphidium neglectum TaxID=145388 RepID=A0A0D2MA40_9CHLO|nr:cyclopropane-fatty-acyl-phospholipid synthase [Monoraphidium neglectum]KIY97831.1 cyclopropane-fatty-acyl-phospholipid synthase [Monoraphidium neglectum]|eukprot:XP_013896851.1 cyclopropane-fatty-acyl-phospholipid synthase [Monoraphidium neglectum]